MYRLMIVEDEEPVSRALRELIPWKDLGFEVAACFENALQAEEFLKADTCDVILTDIVMSGKSGLELAAFAYENYPHIRVIILSGYSEFSYAQQAMKYGVVYYMVKPVDEIELMDTFSKIRASLDEEAKVDQDEQNEKMSNVMLNLKTAFVKLLLANQVETRSELLSNMQLLNIPLECVDKPMMAYTLQFPNLTCNTFDLQDYIMNIEQILDEFSISRSKQFLYFLIPGAEEAITVVIFSLRAFTNPSDMRIHTNRKMEWLQFKVREKCKVQMSFKEQLFWERLEECIQNHLDIDEERLIQEKELYNLLLQYYRLLVVTLDTQDKEQITVEFDKMEEELKRFPENEARLFLKNLLYSVVMHYSVKRNLQVEYFTEELATAGLLNNASVPQLLGRIREIIQNFSEVLFSKNDLETNPIVSGIQKYIMQHLAEDLRVEVLADKYNINPSYMSRLFKQVTGETLTEYLTRMRIEKAIEMMKKKKYKIQDIMLNTGFHSPSYFSTVFKKYTGYTPSLYVQFLSE